MTVAINRFKLFISDFTSYSQSVLISLLKQNSSSNGTIDRRSNQNGTLGRVCRSLVQNGLNNIGGNEDFVEINFGSTGLWNDDPDVKFAKGSLCQYDPANDGKLQM